jgi:hypothetical protein
MAAARGDCRAAVANTCAAHRECAEEPEGDEDQAMISELTKDKKKAESISPQWEMSLWDYVNRYYRDIFGDNNQVTR